MIRLTYSLWDEPIELQENIVNVIVLESPKCFRDFVFEVKKAMRKEESRVLLSKDFEEIVFEKYVHTVLAMNDIDINNKKILTKVYAELNEVAYAENMYLKTMEVHSQILNYMDEIIHHSDINLVHGEFDIDACLKAMDVKIEVEESDLLGLICDYIDVISQFFNIHIFLFFHLKEYLEEEELMQLYQHCHYRKVNLCLCENVARDSLPDEKITLIDRDYCQIS